MGNRLRRGRVGQDVLALLPLDALGPGPLADVVVPFERATAVVLLDIPGSFNVGIAGVYLIIWTVGLGPGTNRPKGDLKAVKARRGVLEGYTRDTILPIHGRTLAELLVVVVEGSDTLRGTSSTTIRKGLEPGEEEVNRTITPGLEGLVVDNLLGVVAIWTGVPPGTFLAHDLATAGRPSLAVRFSVSRHF